MTDQVAPKLPSDEGAEREVIAAIILDPRVFPAVFHIVQSEDFFVRENSVIFGAASQLALRDEPIAPATIADLLLRLGQLSTDLAGYLAQVAEGLHTAKDAEFYARRVKDRSALRNLIKIAADVQQKAYAASDETEAIIAGTIETLSALHRPRNDWRSLFHTYDEAVNAPPLKFAVQNFLQCDAATLLAGLSGQYKTWLMLSIGKALLEGAGTKLWGLFDVIETPKRILYLIPESSLGPFMYRVNKLGLLPYMRDERFLVRTLSKGPAPKLQDPRMLAAAEGSGVFLDTAVRFIEGDESSASDNNRGLAADVFALQAAGVAFLFAAAHSPKLFASQNFMELENMVRGSGDIAAAFATAWGVRQLSGDIAHIQNIKARDFEPCGPFQLAARPYLDEDGNFRLHKPPGDCGSLADEMPETKRSNSGAAPDVRDMKALKIALLRRILTENPNMATPEIVAAFQREKIEIARGTIRKYKSEMGL